MTLQELITDLKAAGANENTMQLAMNCYELGLKNAQVDRHELQKDGNHPAPCARFCEANAFRIAERQLHRRIDDLAEVRTELLNSMKEAREALQFANENPSGGICDTIWMMHQPETLFDFMDAAIAKAEGVKC